MGLFSNILEKLGIKKEEEAPQPITPVVIPSTKPGSLPQAVKPAAPSTKPAELKETGKPMPGGRPFGAVKPAPIPVVDVVARLEKLAKANPEKLNWKTSIVDLLKLLDIDSSLKARKELAVELGCPPEKMIDSAEMNMWLHKTVLRKIALNGGNIPQSLLD
jgi:hypothetical protein